MHVNIPQPLVCEPHLFDGYVVYVEWGKIWSSLNFMTLFGDLYQINRCGISNNFNQFTHLRSASEINNDVIKMAAVALFIRTHIY